MPGTALLDRLRAALAAEYTVLDEIAAGGQGHVFRARDRRLDREVAIKVLRPELVTAEAAARFLREARALARLKHPNVLAVHDTGEADGLSFYVMDLADGESLAARLRNGPLSAPQVHALAGDLLGALDAVHRAGIVHRDVKPANIFLQDARAILGDFGIAHVPTVTDTTTAGHTEPGRLIGTPGYMSPEQLLGAATPRSDLYSAAAVIYEAATGSAWNGVGDPGTADWSRVPRSLTPPLRRALQLDPAGRWPDAAGFRRALDRSATGRRIPLPAAIVGGVACAVGAVMLAQALESRESVRAAASLRGTVADLAVLPFGQDALGRDLASFVASTLEWSPRWTFRPYREVLSWWDSAGSAVEAVTDGRVRAAHWAHGSVRRTGGIDTLVLRLQRPQGVIGMFKVPGDSTDIPRWANAAADTIVENVFPTLAAEFREMMAATSGDYEAQRLLIAGMDAFELDQWDSAGRLLRAALARDPRLDRAAFELDLLHRWSREPPDTELASFVQAAGERMPEPYGSLMRSEQELDLRRRLTVLDSIVREYPRNARARFFFINESFHRAPLVGTSLEEVLRLMEAGIAASPYFNQVSMYDHLVWGYIHIGIADSARSALARRSALVRGGRADDQFGALLQLAYDARFHPFLARVKAAVALPGLRKDPAVLARMLRFALTFDVPALQRQLGAGLAGSADPAVRTTARMAEGLALLELGRLREGLGRVDTAAALIGTPAARVQALAWRIVPATLGIPFADSAARRRAVAELGTMARTGGRHALEASWVLALDAAERAPPPDRELRLFPDGAGPSARYLATILAGVELARHGRYDSALAVTATAIIDDSSGAVGSAFARSVLHVHRGRWQRQAGRPADADRSWRYHENSHLRGYPAGVTQAGEVDAILSVYVRLLRAELAMELGDTVRACRFARRAREHWDGADDALRPFVMRAELGGACH